jgi:hypothetical protein
MFLHKLEQSLLRLFLMIKSPYSGIGVSPSGWRFGRVVGCGTRDLKREAVSISL